jgi:hypothetical protein
MLFALLFLQSKTTTNKQDKHHILVVKLKFVAHFQIFGKNLTLRLYTHQPTNSNQLDPIHILSKKKFLALHAQNTQMELGMKA